MCGCMGNPLETMQPLNIFTVAPMSAVGRKAPARIRSSCMRRRSPSSSGLPKRDVSFPGTPVSSGGGQHRLVPVAAEWLVSTLDSLCSLPSRTVPHPPEAEPPGVHLYSKWMDGRRMEGRRKTSYYDGANSLSVLQRRA